MNVRLHKIEVDDATATALEKRAVGHEGVVRWLDAWETPRCRFCDARRQ